MVETVAILLTDTSGKLVMQRRDAHAPTNPNKLGLFSGFVKRGEKPEKRIRLELAEETSLDVTQLDIRPLFTMDIKGQNDNPDNRVHVFRAGIGDRQFKVFEGIGSERYRLEEALVRDDLDFYVKKILHKVAEDNNDLKHN